MISDQASGHVQPASRPGWETKRLGETLRLLPTANNPRSELNEDGAVVYLHYGDIHAFTQPVLDCSRAELPRIEENRVRGVTRLHDGDLVMVDASEDLLGIGKSVEVRNVDGREIVAGLHTILCRSNTEERWARGFKAYVQFIPEFASGIRRIATGMSVYGISKKQLADITFPLPSCLEQRAIVAVLSDVDCFLESLDALIAKRKWIKKAAMQHLLSGKIRLPGFSGEWEARRIDAFARCTAGGTPSTTNPEYWGGPIPWMSSGELNKKVVHDVEGRITAKGLRESSAQLLPPRCVLIGLAGQGKTRGTVARNTVALSTNQSIAAVLPNASFVTEYLYFNLDARYLELRELSTGAGGRGGLNLAIIRSVLVPFPPVAEQSAIAAVLLDLDAEITTLEQRRDKTQALKQGMMQQLLTGWTRLVEPPATGDEATAP